MGFNPGDRVSLIGYAIPMTVESISGDDVHVVRYDAKARTIREKYKAGALQPTPRRGGAITFRF